MEIHLRKIFVLLASLLFSATEITRGDAIKGTRARHLFVQRQSPLPGTPRKLFKLEHEALDNLQSSGDQDAHKVFSRVRRSTNPDVSPRMNEVGHDVVVSVMNMNSKLRVSKLKLQSTTMHDISCKRAIF